MDGHVAAAERRDLLRDDVAGVDLVAELGEAGGRDQADPADADYPIGSFSGMAAGEAT